MKYLHLGLSAVALIAAPAPAPKAHEKIHLDCAPAAAKPPECKVNVKPRAKAPDLFHGVKPVAKPVRM
ncbi:MAG: hypothetical protein EOP11_05730 [Proteobacteria bacterium]|nr:MAG: hypothetical protein EOP11_05730 [Pseudomonadota bacterium]